MRAILAGFVLLALTAAAAAQATGEVEAIGFGGAYRPGCWTPMLVRLQATTGKTENYKLAVVQKDLDKDHIFFTETFTLQGNPEGSMPRDQRFWMYFIPDPASEDDGGIPQNVCNAKLNAAIPVFLFSDSDKSLDKPLMRLNVTQPVQSIDSESRGRKLVLFITAQSRPVLSVFASGLGMSEKVESLLVDEQAIRQTLPENVIGYDAVDAIVWLDADPGRLSEHQEWAIRQYVRRGGRLVVCQSAKPVIWQTIANHWSDLLPVDVDRIDQVDALEALPKITREGEEKITDLVIKFNDSNAKRRVPDRLEFPHYWTKIRPPFDLARARPKPGTFVDQYDHSSPYIVRGMYGRGGVTWVAQDLGDGHLTENDKEADKWLYVWNKVFDWHNDPTPALGESDRGPLGVGDPKYERGNSIDLGEAQSQGMELPSTGAAYVALVVLFFILYWAAAGPGSYLLLASRKRVHLSWFAFAAIAVAATASTALIVHLVLRGPGKLRHVSYVSISPGCPAIVRSEFGLYVPKDSVDGLPMELQGASADSPSYLIAYPITHIENSEGYTAYQKYIIPVSDIELDHVAMDPKSIRMPYRSTLKKFQACWVGDLPGIDASVHCVDDDRKITGTLVNHTGKRLHNIYLAFRWENQTNRDKDYIYYCGFDWVPGGTLDLDAAIGRRSRGPMINTDGAAPQPDHSVWGEIHCPDDADDLAALNWNGYWRKGFHDFFNGSVGENLMFWNDDNSSHPLMAFPLLSLFDRVPPLANKIDKSNGQVVQERVTLLRRGKRQWDISQAVSAGELVVLAQAEGEIPIPLKVEGNSIPGDGVTFYQFILPLDRSKPAPATQPATTPATKPSIKSAPALSAERPRHVPEGQP